MNSTAPTALTPLMFCREVGDTDSHITTDWMARAFCGAEPGSSLGWTLGAGSAWLADLTICEACKTAFGNLNS